MASVNFSPDLKPATWDAKCKATLGKDKAVAAKLDGAKVADALKKLNTANDNFSYEALKYAGASTAKQLDAALADLDAQTKSLVSQLRTLAKASGDAADEFVKASQKVASAFKGDSAKLVSGAAAAATAVSSAAGTFDKDLVKYVEAARVDLKSRSDQAQEKEKKAASPAAGGKPVETKASKLVRARALECFRKIKRPQPGAKPFRFIVVTGKTVVTAYFGPIASTAQEKLLKGLIPDQKPFKTFKDLKGEVIWEGGAVTLVSDRLPPGLAKKMQPWVRKMTGLNVRIRVRKTTGEVEESDQGEDIRDDQLAPDAGEVVDAAAKKQAGKDFTQRLGKLAGAIKLASAGPMAEQINALVASIKKFGAAQKFDEADDQLDEIEALLDEIAETEKRAPAPLAVAEVTKAKEAWAASRTRAVEEIKRLAAELGAAFKDEAAQKAKVGEAVKRLWGLIPKLGPTLETQLDAAVSEKDAARRKALVTKAKITVDNLFKTLEEDDVMINIDNNEIVPDMKIVEPMRDRLAEVEAALG